MNNDTLELLRECDAGVKMGVNSMDEVMSGICGEKLRELLQRGRMEHIRLGDEAVALLDEAGEKGKSPSPLATAGGFIKMNAEMVMQPGDATVITLMAEGCGMGIKGLGKALCKYADADERAKEVARALIDSEERLMKDLESLL